jgi:hypothetical protein
MEFIKHNMRKFAGYFGGDKYPKLVIDSIPAAKAHRHEKALRIEQTGARSFSV